jgi:hypothetical protein
LFSSSSSLSRILGSARRWPARLRRRPVLE